MKNKFTALYVRVSTENQLTGLESQTRALLSYCDLKEIKNFKLYEEFGVSGAKSSRPALDEMIRDCENNLIDSVIVYSFSRFARSTKHLILALEKFDKLQIRFISITENLDMATPLGRTIFQIIGAIGELERELIRDRVRTGLRNARAKGKQLGAKKKYTNPEIFKQLRANGMTIREIAKTVNCSTATVLRMIQVEVF